MRTTKLLALAGSTRQGSWNRALVAELPRLAAELPGLSVEVLDLLEYPLPMYDGDFESGQGVPESARQLAERLGQADGLIVASPEYNASLSPFLKNTLDWVSRTGKVFEGKPVLLLSASPGGLGGLRGLGHLREVLSALGALVMPQQRALARAHEAFDNQGQIREQALQAELRGLTQALGQLASRLAAEGVC